MSSKLEKVVNIIKELDKQDELLERKYRDHVEELKFYEDLLKEANDYFYIIVKNFKNVV